MLTDQDKHNTGDFLTKVDINPLNSPATLSRIMMTLFNSALESRHVGMDPVVVDPALLIQHLLLSSFALWGKVLKKNIFHTWNVSRSNSPMSPLKKNKIKFILQPPPKKEEKGAGNLLVKTSYRRQHHVTYCTNV